MKKTISILGSTGSIGTSTLEVVAAHSERFDVAALAAGDNVELLAQQVRRFRPELVSMRTEAGAEKLRALLNESDTEIVFGEEGIGRVAEHPAAELVVAAVVGAAGLLPTWRAIQAGKDIALANKETLVMAGPLVLAAVKKNGCRLLPVDSEHAAIMQSILGHRHGDIRRVVLTASGGPFRDWPRQRIAAATSADALAHPTWQMGRKITIDSATLMNKGLEVIEACFLFDVPPEKVDVVVHTESIVHSMVEFQDGQVVAQLGVPDMKGPIAYALSYPERLPDVMEHLDLVSAGPLNFYGVDREKFPCLDLAFRALALSELSPAALNAANEEAVHAFLEGKIGFYDISQIIAEVLTLVPEGKAENLDCVIRTDRSARQAAREMIARLAQGD
ncbi:MAG: 1-deoxy-D-xylulose-5-phosphate reductoisomerase [Candidatus Lernaella stagnicola]|nr:1-deoxy-D-xylulose-5-phosphate reductoisomerase [Candidatus Lernaella stagnicola]